VPTNENEISIQLFGDLALTAGYMDPASREAISTNIAFIKDKLPEADLRIANWEAPIVTDQSPNPEKLLTIHTTPETAELARPLELDVALLANNHTFDFLEPGFMSTKGALEAMGLKTAGAGLTKSEADSPFIAQAQGQSPAILNYVDLGTNPGLPERLSPNLNLLDRDRALSDVETLVREGHSVIVCVHWGMDFISVPSPEHVRLARELIKAGAVIVAGHHAHCIQGYERVANGIVFYGLGNFLAGAIYPWPRFTEPAMAVTVKIRNHKVSGFEIHPFILRNEILYEDPSGRVESRLARLNRHFALSADRYRKKFHQDLAYNLAVVRPLHFLKRNRNPLKILGLLKKRHFSEYMEIIRRIASR
jgi:poly-gamma-glutamate capsule biosynthesis protein CapA/YwtB (metallophosphatase superfamily)